MTEPSRPHLRIAYFSPLNPRPTGISDYSEELLPALAELADIDLFVDGYVPSNPLIRERFRIHDVGEYAERRRMRSYDVNLYQMGNSIHHAEIYRTLMRYPGIVVLHDVVLHHFFLELAHHDRDPQRYLRELAYAAGPAGVSLGIAVWRGERPAPLFEYPLIERVVQASLGIIVHNNYARRGVEASGAREIAVVPAHVIPPPVVSSQERLQVRAQLNVPRHAVLVGAFGHATLTKRLDVALRAFAKLHRLYCDSYFVIVGPENPPGWLDERIAELHLADWVVRTGPVTMEQFQRYIAATDVCVNLRYPTAGETSASLLRILAAGVPAIVSRIGSFAELPDDCCLKIPVGDGEEESLVAAMWRLAADENLRRRMGEAGRALVLRDHSPEGTARRYLEFIAALTGGDACRLADAGIYPHHPAEPGHCRISGGASRDGAAAVALESALREALWDLGFTLGGHVASTDSRSTRP